MAKDLTKRDIEASVLFAHQALRACPAGFSRSLYLLNVLAKHFGYSRKTFWEDARHYPLTLHRMLAMSICCGLIGENYTEIARRIDRDHTTVMNAHRRYGERVRAALGKIEERVAA